MIAVLRRAPTAWLLGAFYFLTFGGFVAFSIYLPTLLRAQFGLAPADAGFRAAGFVVARHAHAARWAAGWRTASVAPRCCRGCSAASPLFSLLLTWPSMVPFTVGALACAMLMGLGNGAVFKLVPEHFPKRHRHGHGPGRRARRSRRVLPTAPARRIPRSAGRHLAGIRPALRHGVGAARRESARVPPRRRRVDACAARRRASGARTRQGRCVGHTRRGRPGGGDRGRVAQPPAFRRGARRLHVRDAVCGVRHQLSLRDVAEPAADAHVLAAWMAGVLLTSGAWPATPSASAGARSWSSRPTRYIFRRGRLRGLAHWLIMWGCVLAAAITFPLVWGWIHFETVPGDLHTYRTFVFGIPVQDFPVESALAFVIFHGLVWSSFLVIAGVMLAFRRRMIDHGAVAVQQFGQDILPLLLLFAISVTGLMLTASYTWMRGYAYEFLAILHAATVIVTLLWLPFGKLFHVFQRPAQLGVGFYKDAGARGQQAACRRCGQPYASLPMVRDLIDRRAGARIPVRAAGRRALSGRLPQVPAGAVRTGARRACGGST